MDIHYDVAQNCLFRKVRTISRYVTNLYAKVLKDIGLTPVQYSMMTAIEILKEPNMNAFSKATAMDRTTINRNLKPLIRDGIVRVVESEDKRERIVSLTENGKKIYIRGYENWKKAQHELEEKIGKKNWDNLNLVLDDAISIVSQ